jgi:hypothetical protein
MPLKNKPDFQRWLEREESGRRALERGGMKPPDQPGCEVCGTQLDEAARCGQCLPCLAERFGREQAETAAHVGRVLMVALVSCAEVPVDIVRSSIEDVMDEYECVAAMRDGC